MPAWHSEHVPSPTDPPTDHGAGHTVRDRRPRRTIVVLGLLPTFGPISLDLYLPVLPGWPPTWKPVPPVRS